MRLFRPIFLLKLFYPQAIFRIKTRNKELCLTFDDGPHPESTPRILDILDAHNIKALFFCSGQEAEKYPGLIALIISKGHIVGNHGYRHLDGLITNTDTYVRNISKASGFTSQHLLRPPFGRIRPSQYRELLKNYRIVLWDLMPYDFDKKMSSEKVLCVLKKRIRPGSVIALHDKVCSSVHSFLEDFIIYAGDKGYKFVISPFSGKK
jgi:peptidoglycan/xylan/chitin deacetylase (PgdA/CDA1 family)